MAQSSRRGFLKAASGTAAVTALAGRMPAWGEASPAGPVPTGPVKVWSTWRDRRHTAGEALTWKPAGLIGAEAIMLDPATTKQSILGFGAAMTDSSCYLLSQLSDAERAPIMHDFFSPDEMALNVCRTAIGSSDYSRSVYSFSESTEPDPELKNFSIDHDKAYILPMLREARKDQSRTLSLLLALEPARMDEAQQLHARRRDAQNQSCALREVLHEIPRRLQGRGRQHRCRHRAERSRRRTGRPHVRLCLGAGGRD